MRRCQSPPSLLPKKKNSLRQGRNMNTAERMASTSSTMAGLMATWTSSRLATKLKEIQTTLVPRFPLPNGRKGKPTCLCEHENLGFAVTQALRQAHHKCIRAAPCQVRSPAPRAPAARNTRYLPRNAATKSSGSNDSIGTIQKCPRNQAQPTREQNTLQRGCRQAGLFRTQDDYPSRFLCACFLSPRHSLRALVPLSRTRHTSDDAKPDTYLLSPKKKKPNAASRSPRPHHPRPIWEHATCQRLCSDPSQSTSSTTQLWLVVWVLRNFSPTCGQASAGTRRADFTVHRRSLRRQWPFYLLAQRPQHWMQCHRSTSARDQAVCACPLKSLTAVNPTTWTRMLQPSNVRGLFEQFTVSITDTCAPAVQLPQPSTFVVTMDATFPQTRLHHHEGRDGLHDLPAREQHG